MFFGDWCTESWSFWKWSWSTICWREKNNNQTTWCETSDYNTEESLAQHNTKNTTIFWWLKTYCSWYFFYHQHILKKKIVDDCSVQSHFRSFVHCPLLRMTRHGKFGPIFYFGMLHYYPLVIIFILILIWCSYEIILFLFACSPREVKVQGLAGAREDCFVQACNP